ncbi:hypothetical protein DAPPUDRAFT_279127, partial [Daphnia pulex]
MHYSLFQKEVGSTLSEKQFVGHAVSQIPPPILTAQEVLALVRKRLVNLIELESLSEHWGEREGLPVPERARAGVVLSQLVDPRPGVGVAANGLPDIDWVELPPGRFKFGANRKEAVIPASFKISRYPTTIRQFRAFVDASGYKLAEFWKDAAAAGVWRDGKVKESGAHDWRDCPVDHGPEFGVDNHPIVG